MKFHLVTAKINADAANVPYEEHPKTAYCGFILAEG